LVAALVCLAEIVGGIVLVAVGLPTLGAALIGEGISGVIEMIT
jgi:hypothetical protein